MTLEKWALLVAILALLFDFLIFAWLVFTWFYEGHHKKCEVEVACSHCGHKESHKCSADPRNKEAGMSTKLGTGKATRETDKALKIELETGEELWIPKKVIHDDSDVYDAEKNSEGEVIVQTWWAEKEGLA